ncbi:polysaccharide deacetylase family protein [Candidatus Peregrinibacteria bacterium]|nr:polysaccharide deacetylase family protein [Candidatus Peregrinibacteria bacterium]
MHKNKHHKTICFYFQVHQPYRLNDYNFFSQDKEFFQGPIGAGNKEIFEKVAYKCYLPMTNLLYELLEVHPDFKVSFSLSGVFIEQCLEFGEIGERVLQNFQRLIDTGRVEILAETYYHSLTFLYSKQDYAEQIHKHRKLVKTVFGVWPKVFRNTELIYNNEIANFIKEMGFSGMLLEGWDPILSGKKQHHVLEPVKSGLHSDDQVIARKYNIGKRKEDFGLLLKDYKLSDDIAFRFGQKSWPSYPLTVEKYADWLGPIMGDTINLFMDFETFGEHQWEDTGIFEFMKALPAELLRRGYGFATPSETLKLYERKGEVDCHNHLSWADLERDLSAWTGNPLQDSCIGLISEMEKYVHVMKHSRKKDVQALVHKWRLMQTSDHFYYMCLKFWEDGDVHKYFSPYDSPYEAYISYMNVYNSLKQEIIEKYNEINNA